MASSLQLRRPAFFAAALALVFCVWVVFKPSSTSHVHAQQVAAPPKVKEAKDVKSVAFEAYTDTIPGSDVVFSMVPIPGGRFKMGSPSSEAKRGEDEGPLREVEIAPFWMGKYEVTWPEFDQFAFSLDVKRRAIDKVQTISNEDKAADALTRPTPPYADMTFGFGHDGNPAICMTHHAAMEFCRWLSAKTGKLYRLPTEAEWEYACRAGSTTAYSFGDDPDQLKDYAWYVENAEGPQPVGKKKPNKWGLYDMHGNLDEWCIDLYKADAYKIEAANKLLFEPFVAPTPNEYPYTVRGGSWDDDPELLRSSAAGLRIRNGASGTLRGLRASGGTPTPGLWVFGS